MMNISPDMIACHMFCRRCGYALIGLPSNRCPECGREFDPANPRTFLAHPRRVVLRRIIRIAIILLCLTLPLDGYVGYLAWCAHQESHAIQFLRANGVHVTVYHIMPSWAKVILRGHGGSLWKRAETVGHFPTLVKTPEFMAAVARFKSLRKLDLGWWPGESVTDDDMAQIEGLTALQELDIFGTDVTDAGLAHLKGLTSLQKLNLFKTGITDAGVAQLKGMKALQQLDLCETQVTDAGLAQLKGLTNLKSVMVLNDPQLTDSGVADLQKALPQCFIWGHWAKQHSN
jgi:hypothetical protein